MHPRAPAAAGPEPAQVARPSECRRSRRIGDFRSCPGRRQPGQVRPSAPGGLQGPGGQEWHRRGPCSWPVHRHQHRRKSGLGQPPCTFVAQYYRLPLVSSRDPVLHGQTNREGLESRSGPCLRAGPAARRTEEAPPPQRGMRSEQPQGPARQPPREARGRPVGAALDSYQRSVPDLLRLDRRRGRRRRDH